MLNRSLPILAFALSGVVHAAGPNKSASNKSASNKSASNKSAWKTSPYLQSVAGLSSFTSGGKTFTAINLGGEAGMRYWQKTRKLPRWSGRARARATYLISAANAEGLELRAGNFIGPKWKQFGLQAGPDLFWNQYSYGAIELVPSAGMGFPVTGTLNAKPLTLYGGFEPAWYQSSSREAVDWSEHDAFGFGDEFSLFGGVGLSLDKARVGFNIQQTVSAYGTRLGYGVSVNLR